MNAFCEYLAEHGGMLLAGATLLLALGCAGVVLQRRPIHRQRAGEVGVLAVLVWLALACLPLPRWSLPGFSAIGSVARDSPHTSQSAAALRAGEVSSARGPPGPGSDGDSTRGIAYRLWAAQNSPRLLSIAYVSGGVGCFAWLAFGRILLVRIVWSASSPEPWLRELYDGAPFARRHRPRLLISDRCTRPISFGIWRPTIVLPRTACRPDRAGLLRHVLLHELAHVQRRDGWGRLLFNMAFPLLYFHPLYWWLRSRACLAAEVIADDWATDRTAKESYVKALIALAKQRGGQQLAYVGSLQVFGSRSQFYRRMQMLLHRKTRLARQCSLRWRLVYPTACVLAVVVFAGALGVRPGHAQETRAQPDDTVVRLQKECGALRKQVEKLQQQLLKYQEKVKQLEAHLARRPHLVKKQPQLLKRPQPKKQPQLLRKVELKKQPELLKKPTGSKLKKQPQLLQKPKLKKQPQLLKEKVEPEKTR